MKLSERYLLPSSPKVKIFDILAAMSEFTDPFSSADVSFLFGISSTDACVRLNKLKRWDLIQRVKPGRPALYQITSWGRRFLANRERRMAKAAMKAIIQEDKETKARRPKGKTKGKRPAVKS